MKIISWNVNGIRAVVRKGFLDFLRKANPDILCLQEIKIAEEVKNKEKFDFPGYQEFWNCAQRPGYSGTAILINEKIVGAEYCSVPLLEHCSVSENVNNGFDIKKFDIEGRVQTAEFKKFYLVNVYFPNANHELSRLNYKLEFNDNLLKYLKKLEKKKPVIIGGDFNVAHQEIDLSRPKDNIGNPGFTYEERDWMTKFFKAGFIDTFRKVYPKKQEFSWWSYKFNARARNIGWRIDYFCVSAKLVRCIKKPFILNKIQGSDHCPVGIEIKF